MESPIKSELGQQCIRELLAVWLNFDKDLTKVPIVKRLESKKLSIEDYQLLLLNMRQQVIEGSRWISRTASSFDRNYSDVRSMIIKHAFDEHKDFNMLEIDYISAGGKIEDIQDGERNPGSEALHGYLMYRASLPNPVELVGAMWIIEGLGNKMSLNWAKLVNEQFKPEKNITQFLSYHGENDEHHMNELYELVDRIATSKESVAAIVKTAKVVGKLYCLQLEEIDNG